MTLTQVIKLSLFALGNQGRIIFVILRSTQLHLGKLLFPCLSFMPSIADFGV